MNKSKISMVLLTGLFALAIQSYGQPSVFEVKVKGTSLTTNASGDIVSQKIDNKSFIQDARGEDRRNQFLQPHAGPTSKVPALTPPHPAIFLKW